MTKETPEPDIAKIRQLLLAAFTPEDLRRFCYDRPTFRPIVPHFGSGHGLTDMVDRVVEYCDRHVLLDGLLTEVRQYNPRQYARFFESAPPDGELEEPEDDQPPPPTSELLTISHPISLHLARIPAGEFQMGSVMARDRHAEEDELPPHPVRVTEFHIGRYPVTNRQYRAFVRATGYEMPRHWEESRIPLGKQNHPVVLVTWHDGVAFCAWLRAETGRPFRLPTEAEWEKAARGTDSRTYPWGDNPPDRDRCNFDQPERTDGTTTIGRYSPQGDSPYGCADMAGNVHEWCLSLYESYPYQADDGRDHLQSGGLRVLRGGSWAAGERAMRCASRRSNYPDNGWSDIGFRVCLAAQQE
jgi:formylglycine-generating enzyme required for sulfatase activity